jgi:predicted membrane protein
VLVGILLITGGTLLFIDNLGILPISASDAFWPLILLVFSAIGFYRTGSLPVKIWAAAGMVAGALLILGAFHVIHATADILWPLILIAAGVVMIIYRLRWRSFTERVHIGSNSKTATSQDKLQEVAVFSGIKKRVETPKFEGGEMVAVFGSIELDLRWSHISAASRVVTMETNAVFGGIEIRIPETWKLSIQGHAVFGTYEDKTIPPRPEPGVEAPTLIINGGTAFGSVVVRN